MTGLEVVIIVGTLDIVGCLIAAFSGLPFRNLYWLPMGGWIALWRERRSHGS